jgi:hypothetical protein
VNTGVISRSEWRWCGGAAMAVMALTCLPYLFLWGVTPPGMRFLGFVVNLDDQCVYLAWMKQASEGHFLLRNLWTADPQRGINVHLLFWLLGVFSRATSLALPLVYHGGRLLLGAGVLLLFYRFTAFYTEDVFARRTCFWLAALSAGFGWLYHPGGIQGFVDWWQPEAITFQSLYSNALFCSGLVLMLGVLVGLADAERSHKGNRFRWAVVAGGAGALLANIHSYDVFTLAAVWITYLLVRGIVERRLPVASLLDSILVAALALPAVAYQVYVYQTEPVFRARADMTLTVSPAWWKLVLGYGLLVPLAAWGAALLVKESRTREEGARLWLPIIWATVGLAVPYLPVSFQRKMVMGLHLPVALLAGIGLAQLARLAAARAPKHLANKARAAVAVAGVTLTIPTNVLVITHQLAQAVTENLSTTQLHPVFWKETEFAALRWADEHLTGDPVLQSLTVSAVLIPPFTGHRVWAGHWSETPAFYLSPENSKVGEVNRFFTRWMPPTERERWLRERSITHVIFGPYERGLDRGGTGGVEAQLREARFLEPLHTAGTGDDAVTIYAVR